MQILGRILRRIYYCIFHGKLQSEKVKKKRHSSKQNHLNTNISQKKASFYSKREKVLPREWIEKRE